MHAIDAYARDVVSGKILAGQYGLGNAIVPAIAEWIGRQILEAEGLI
jgi:hypothetical protein